jgi:hypothetical protein
VLDDIGFLRENACGIISGTIGLSPDHGIHCRAVENRLRNARRVRTDYCLGDDSDGWKMSQPKSLSTKEVRDCSSAGHPNYPIQLRPTPNAYTIPVAASGKLAAIDEDPRCDSSMSSMSAEAIRVDSVSIRLLRTQRPGRVTLTNAQRGKSYPPQLRPLELGSSGPITITREGRWATGFSDVRASHPFAGR